MFSTTDTIVAIATPPGRGGIGVVRLSGPDAHAIARRLITHKGALEPRRATFTLVRHARGPGKPDARDRVVSGFPSAPVGPARRTDAIDQVVVTYFPAPASYTGDDVVEVSAHGSPVILRAIVTSAIENGARLAEPGEFTLRAFLNGRLDLMQAEAVADLVDAVTPLQARAAFDQLQGTLTRAIARDRCGALRSDRAAGGVGRFSRRGLPLRRRRRAGGDDRRLIARTGSLLADARRGRLVREGLQIAIVGEPNVGKIERVQRARRRRARDRHRRARHDARSGDRGRRPRRPSRDAGRHGRPSGHERRDRGRGRRTRAAGSGCIRFDTGRSRSLAAGERRHMSANN